MLWLRIPLAALFLFASLWALRLAYADFLLRRNTPASRAHAAALFPASGDLQARIGNLREAVKLNPYLSSAWIEMALAAEGAGRIEEAEAALLEAARVDQMFEPRWTLANFYFRRGREAEFWRWVRLAAERSYGDRTAVFRLCHRLTDDAAKVLAALPSTDPVLADYVRFAMERADWTGAEKAGFDLVAVAQPDRHPLLESLLDQLIETAHRRETAVRLSAAMTARGMAPSGHGFDWRPLWRPGVAVNRKAGLRITLSGQQEEQTALLVRWWPLEPNRSYRLHSRNTGLSRDSGIVWEIEGVRSPALSAEGEPGQSLDFRAPADGLARLELWYRRRPGTRRAEGTIQILDVSVDPL